MIYKQVERIAKVPADKLDNDNFTRIQNLDANIKEKLYGQEETVNQVLERIYVSFAGIGHETKPLASFLLLADTF